MDQSLEDSLRTFVVKFGYKTVVEKLEGLRAEFRQFYEEQLAFISGAGAAAPAVVQQFLIVDQAPPTPPPTPTFQPEVPLLNEFSETNKFARSTRTVKNPICAPHLQGRTN